MTATTEPLAERLEPYGACPGGVVDLRETPTPDGVPYLDFVRAGSRTAIPDGVVESRGDGRGEPLAYVADLESEPAPRNLALLLKNVTLRADAPYLVAIEPGQLAVYECAWRDDPGSRLLEKVRLNADHARATFQRLNLALIESERGRTDLHELLFGLMTSAIDNLIHADIGRDNAISLAGRALFLRFLIDRNIISNDYLQEVCPSATKLEDVFSGPQRAASTCEWLDQTFNGDFLPLSLPRRKGSFETVRTAAFDSLANILHRSPGGQRLLDWGDLDFAHLPIGLLSQVYERQARAWDPLGQRRKSVYYTPHRIADLMVQEVFANLRASGSCRPHEARVLDPAAGGGVFLVTAFQEIVAEWWRCHGRPPDTQTLRKILYQQLTGFEINEAALRLAALSLYLKAIELDFEPHPPSKLRFEPLRGRVLHSVLAPGEADSLGALGSLGPSVAVSHRGAYDVVIGNPPWTALIGQEGTRVHREVIENIRPIVATRLGNKRAEAFTIPDRVPDLPFVWRSLEWAKPGGWIAFALHGRLLFKNFEAGRQAREDLFQALQVRAILNGADLRKTAVWPEVTTPFCLLFAMNHNPAPGSNFYFTSPYREDRLNKQGRLRLDAKARSPVTLGRVLARPDLLKVLFRGTVLDASLLEKIQAAHWRTMGLTFANTAGGGYKLGGKGQQDPGFLSGMPNLTTDYDGPVLINTNNLPIFAHNQVHRRRKSEIYKGPVVILRRSIPYDRNRGRAFLSNSDVAYNWSFFGYSACNHPRSEILARYQLLVLHSDLFLWHTLVRSSQFGVERDLLLKEDVDDFPLPPIDDIPGTLRESIVPLTEGLFEGRCKWSDLDEWTANVYGLSRWDEEVVRDSLQTALPFSNVEREAQRPPTNEEIEAFRLRLEREIAPFGRAVGAQLRVRHLHIEGAPWEVLSLEVGNKNSTLSRDRSKSWLAELFARADQEGASRILVHQSGLLLIGILRQFRFWTPSRARLCALEIVQEDLGVLFPNAS